MDRRSWPWKKKSSDNKNEALDLTYSGRNHEEQQTGRTLPEDSASSFHEQEERNRVLSEKVSLAAGEITAKDNLVKQHAKVAEEAVSGWEKAEKEAGVLKKQLEHSVQQRLTLESRVSHLEGALKECMRELRTARDEHEHKLQEVQVRKSAEFEKVRQDMERKLSAAADRLIEAEAQKNALSRSLQERARTIAELTEAKTRAETEANVTLVQKQEVEKTCAALKYEVQVLAKEVEIRNDEKESNRKMADTVSKQQLENVKKITKLEAECQRLRGLVRKKLPGPGAIAQMRMEVDGLHSRSKGYGNRSSDIAEEVSQADSREGDRLLAMEEETKMLKEALAKKTQELQSARLMCAKTASKLSLVEEQLERAQPGSASKMKSSNNTESHASADSWASALVAQLEQFKKGKEGSYSEKLFDSFDLMDDFAEMEQLATTSSASTTASESGVLIHDEKLSYEETLLRKEELCVELKRRLAAAEEQIRCRCLENKNSSNLVNDMDRIFAEARDRCALRKLLPSDNNGTADSKDKLRSAVCKLIQLVESLAQEASSFKSVAEDDMKRLISAANELLHGNGDVLDFIGKLSSVLSCVQALGVRELSAKSGRCSEVGESKSLDESDGDVEFNNYITLQEDNTKLKAEKASMDQELHLAKEKIERLKQQLSESEQLVSNLRVQLSSLEASKQLAENELAVMANVKAELESKVRASCIEMGHLQENIATLESELREQRQRREEASKVQVQFPAGVPRSPRPLNEEAARLQEKEIAAAAEKLADCQRTIIALGKQLNSLSVPSGASSSMDFSDASESPAEPLRHAHQPFSLKTELVQSESDDESEHHTWKVQRSVSDMSRIRTARENIRKQEIYWSSALSPEPSLDNSQPASSERVRKPSQEGELFTNPPLEERSSSSGPKHSGFSRFFHRRASLH